VGEVKLLLIGPQVPERAAIKNYTGVQSFYLARELRRRGVKLEFVDSCLPDEAYGETGVDCDHVLALGLRWFTKRSIGLARRIRQRLGLKGAVTQLHDGLVHDSLRPLLEGLDVTFTTRDDAVRTPRWERYAKDYHHIGWAADPELFHPQQLRGELRILIDHPTYKPGGVDQAQVITYEAVNFTHTTRWRDRFRSVRLRRLVDNGVEDVSLDNVRVPLFHREHVPLETIAAEYRRTYVFLPTHKESVGLTCLEAAMCGALVVAPKGCIYQDRLDTVRHVQYEGRVPWQEVLDKCDFRASSCKALQQSWPKVADRLLKWFGDFK
jgi:hypothetical protein